MKAAHESWVLKQLACFGCVGWASHACKRVIGLRWLREFYGDVGFEPRPPKSKASAITIVPTGCVILAGGNGYSVNDHGLHLQDLMVFSSSFIAALLSLGLYHAIHHYTMQQMKTCTCPHRTMGAFWIHLDVHSAAVQMVSLLSTRRYPKLDNMRFFLKKIDLLPYNGIGEEGSSNSLWAES